MYDLLANLPLSPLLITFWSIIAGGWGIMSPLLTMTCLVETLTDAYPKTRPYRLCLCIALCVFGLFFNSLILNPLHYVIVYTWLYNGINIVYIGVMLPYFLGIFLYSVKNITNDYYFTHGRPLAKFWTVAFKFSCVVAVVSAIE